MTETYQNFDSENFGPIRILSTAMDHIICCISRATLMKSASSSYHLRAEEIQALKTI